MVAGRLAGVAEGERAKSLTGTWSRARRIDGEVEGVWEVLREFGHWNLGFDVLQVRIHSGQRPFTHSDDHPSRRTGLLQ